MGTFLAKIGGKVRRKEMYDVGFVNGTCREQGQIPVFPIAPTWVSGSVGILPHLTCKPRITLKLGPDPDNISILKLDHTRRLNEVALFHGLLCPSSYPLLFQPPERLRPWCTNRKQIVSPGRGCGAGLVAALANMGLRLQDLWIKAKPLPKKKNPTTPKEHLQNSGFVGPRRGVLALPMQSKSKQSMGKDQEERSDVSLNSLERY